MFENKDAVQTSFANPTKEESHLVAQTLFRSIGYEGVPLPGLAFDFEKCIVSNKQGRVWDHEVEEIIPNEYVVGWAKRGPEGVVGSNKLGAMETMSLLLEDFNQKQLVGSSSDFSENVENWIKEKNLNTIRFSQWKKIDTEEKKRGERIGKVREKLIDVNEMFQVANKKL